MSTKLEPLPEGTIELAQHWTLVDPGVINGSLREKWQECHRQHPEYTTVIVEVDYHFGDRDYSLAAYLCRVRVPHGHDAYFKEGRIRLAMSSIEDFFGIAYWFADDWMMDNLREEAKQSDEDIENLPGYEECFPFRHLFDTELAQSAFAQDLGPQTTTWIDLLLNPSAG
jgi:hypothetical protein